MSPAPVSGQLLGMPVEDALEITDMFPFAASLAESEGDQEAYLFDMLKCLRDVNVDHTAVGWYQSVALDAPIQPSFIDNQVAYQTAIPNSCFLVYDSLRSAQGPPSLRAYRLRDSYLRAVKEANRHNGRVSHGILADLVQEGIVEELSVKISVSAIDKLLLASMEEAGELPTPNILGSENAIKLALAGLAQNLIISLDESISESSRVQHYIRSVNRQQQVLAAQQQKRRAENAQRVQAGEPSLPEDDLQLNLRGISDPPRLGLLLCAAQMKSLLGVCDEVLATAKQ